MLRLRVRNLQELREKHQAGDYVSGTVYSTPEGSFTISLYPSGDKLSNAGFIGVYLTCLSLKESSIKGVRVGATWNMLAEDGTLLTSRHEKLTPILLTPDPGDDPGLGKGRGYTNFACPKPDLVSFTITCDFVIREVVREDGTTEQSKGEVNTENLDGLLSSVRRVFDRELEGARKARVLAVEELVELSQEDLLRLQENLALAMSKRMEMEMKCAICLERQKDHVCVPCGHRYCHQCVAQVSKCPECREPITSKLKVF